MKRNNKTAFTLIELLVVISIIALLLSILMPSLQKAKEAAKRIVCMSNLKQISTASRVYRNDWNGIFPSVDGASLGATISPNWGYYGQWCTGGQNDAYYDNIAAIPVENRPLNKYIGNALKVWLCPSDGSNGYVKSMWAEAPKRIYNIYGSSYAFNTNANAGGYGGLWGKKETDVRQPASVIEQYEFSAAMYFKGREDSFYDDRLFNYPRWHDKKKTMSNLLFCDGHADYVLMKSGAEFQVGPGYRFLPE